MSGRRRLEERAGFAPRPRMGRDYELRAVLTSCRCGVYDREMEDRRDLAAFVLAGGKSTRMGQDKAFLNYAGRSLLARALEIAHSVAPEVRIVGSREKFARDADVVEDIFSGRGPLAGIHAALRASQADLNLMIAVDMPLLSQEFLQYLTNVARHSDAIAIVPRAGGHWQPLCAIYRRNFADVAERELAAGRNKIDSLFGKTETLPIEEPELQRAGFFSSLFRNLNTPEELEELEKQISDLKSPPVRV